MDPDACLKQIRELISTINEAETDGKFLDDLASEIHQLVECVEALDDWINKGGFLPAQWAANLRERTVVDPSYGHD